MSKQQIESCFTFRLHEDDREALNALIDEDAAALAAIRAKRAAVRATCKTYTDAYDTCKTDKEREVVLGMVQITKDFSKTDFDAKVASVG